MFQFPTVSIPMMVVPTQNRSFSSSYVIIEWKFNNCKNYKISLIPTLSWLSRYFVKSSVTFVIAQEPLPFLHSLVRIECELIFTKNILLLASFQNSELSPAYMCQMLSHGSKFLIRNFQLAPKCWYLHLWKIHYSMKRINERLVISEPRRASPAEDL